MLHRVHFSRGYVCSSWVSGSFFNCPLANQRYSGGGLSRGRLPFVPVTHPYVPAGIPTGHPSFSRFVVYVARMRGNVELVWLVGLYLGNAGVAART